MLDTMHPAVLDRMEIIEVGGYTVDEKKAILDSYLMPTAIKKAGLNKDIHNFSITNDAINTLLVNYCREPGVRSLQRHINKIMEKISFKLVEEGEHTKVEVNSDNL